MLNVKEKLLGGKKEKVFENAKNFEEHRLEFESKEKRLAYIIAAIGCAFGVLSLVALIFLLPLKQTDVEVFTVDKQTGRTEKITTVKKEEVTNSEALAKYFASNYIKYREGYNYFRAQHDFDATMLFGTDEVNQPVIDLYNSEQSPEKIYNKADFTVTINVISVLLSDSGNSDERQRNLATIRFEKVIRAVGSREVRKQYWTARVTYLFIPERELTEQERQSNPLGFTVTSYLAEKDLRGE